MLSMVTSLSCKASKSRSASFTKSIDIGRPVKLALAITRLSAPSSSRTLDRNFLAINFPAARHVCAGINPVLGEAGDRC